MIILQFLPEGTLDTLDCSLPMNLDSDSDFLSGQVNIDVQLAFFIEGFQCKFYLAQ